jgi:hypothetical protein
MRLLRLLVLCCVLWLVGCQGPPPTQIYIVLSPTPNPDEATQTPIYVIITATSDAIAAPATADNATSVSANATSTTNSTASATASPVLTANPIPTNTNTTIQIAEQGFESGRMFWLQPSRQIWVLFADGTWRIFPDTFNDGDAEPTLTTPPPQGMSAPVRGFGKLWRENSDVRAALGWAVTQEIGYITPYEYHPAGALNELSTFVPAPGYHVLYNNLGEAFTFDEASSRWFLGLPTITLTPSTTPQP